MLELATPVEFFDESSRIAPVGLRFDIEFEKDFCSEHAFNLYAGSGTDLFQHLSAFADEDSLLPPALAVDGCGNAGETLPFFEVIDDHGCCVWNLLARVQEHLLTNALGRHETSGLIGDFVFREVCRTCRQGGEN